MQIKSLISTHIIPGLSCLCVGGFEITGKEEKKERKEERKGYKITKPSLLPFFLPSFSTLFHPFSTRSSAWDVGAST